jgi:hypothetical protein
MRWLAVLSCAGMAAMVATQALAYPTGSEALEARLLAKMGPTTRIWITHEGAREAGLRSLSGDSARSAAFQYGAAGAGIDALAFLVLMQAERNADAAVRGVAVADMSANAEREDARQDQLRSGGINQAQQAQKSGSNQLVESANAKPAVSLLPPPPGTPTKPFTLRTGVPEQGSAAPPGIDLQDAMDRESTIDDLVEAAMKPVTPAQEAAVPAMP